MPDNENNDADERPDEGESDTGTLSYLLLHWSEEYEQGRDVPAEELCRDHPEHIDELASLIAHQKGMNKFNSGSCQGEGVPQRENSHSASWDNEETPLQPGDEPWPGYCLIERQGKGAFGEVWSALREGVLYALKIIRQNQREHLKIEKEGLRQMSGMIHPHILRRYWYWVRGKSLFIITELADASLEQHFENLRDTRPFLSLCAEAIWLLRDAAEALDYLMAEKNLMHLDIKPSNLLHVKGRCKLGDFGTVRPFSQSGDAEVVLSAPAGENPGEVATIPFRSLDEVPWDRAFHRGATLHTVGVAWTPHYASPERFVGKSSKSSDQYSLALTFCELVADRIPFLAKKEDQLGERREGRMNLDFMPSVLHPLLLKALSPNPEDRFPSCLEFLWALREVLLPLVDDGEAKHYLIDVQEGGEWPEHGNEKPASDTPMPLGADEKKTIDLMSVNRSLTSQQKSNKNPVKTRSVRKRLTGLFVAAAALTLAPCYFLAHQFERLGNHFGWLGEQRRYNVYAWRGTMILYALVVCLAAAPFVILVKWIDQLSPIVPPWFETEMKQQPSPEPKQPSPKRTE